MLRASSTTQFMKENDHYLRLHGLNPEAVGPVDFRITTSILIISFIAIGIM